jgi:hypothetical protein
MDFLIDITFSLVAADVDLAVENAEISPLLGGEAEQASDDIVGITHPLRQGDHQQCEAIRHRTDVPSPLAVERLSHPRRHLDVLSTRGQVRAISHAMTLGAVSPRAPRRGSRAKKSVRTSRRSACSGLHHLLIPG